MANLILPAETDYTLALREPNLLVPGRKPVGWVEVKSNSLARGLQFAALVQPHSALRDISGNHSISLQGGATVSSAIGAGSFFMDHTATAHFVNTAYSGVTGNGARTIAFWIRSNRASAGVDENCIFSYGREQIDDVYGTAFRLNNESGTLTLRINGGAATWSTTGLNTGDHCVILSMPEAPRISDVVLDYDGKSLGTGSVQTTLISTGTDFPFRLGRINNTIPAAGTWFGGWLWNVFFWDRQLLQSERAEFYFRGLGSIVEPANSTPYLISVPTSGATVTLSSPTATATGSTTATVGCTVTYT